MERRATCPRGIIGVVAAARDVSEFELAGFVWKQGGTGLWRAELSAKYFENFQRMATPLRQDLDAPQLPVYVGTYASDAEIAENDARLRTCWYGGSVARTQSFWTGYSAHSRDPSRQVALSRGRHSFQH